MLAFFGDSLAFFGEQICILDDFRQIFYHLSGEGLKRLFVPSGSEDRAASHTGMCKRTKVRHKLYD